jgi:small subunit ribosomal protein S1
VIEFNKDSKRIIVSHSRIFEDEQRAEARKEKETVATTASTEKKGKKSKKDKKEEDVIQQPSIEKTTLGDISELAELKEKMESNNKEE